MLDTLGPWIIPLGAILGALGGLMYSRFSTSTKTRAEDRPSGGEPTAAPAPTQPAEHPAEIPSANSTKPAKPKPPEPDRPPPPSPPPGDAPAVDWVTHAEILDFDGFPAEARDSLTQALDICARAVESDRRTDVGVALARALTVATSLADQAALARGHALLGRLSERMDDGESAHEHYLTALELYENTNDRQGIGAICELLARLHARRDDPEGAEAYWRYGLSLATARGDRAEEARILGVLGRLATVNGDLDGAEELFREAMTLEEALGRPLEEGFLTADLARLERGRGDLDTARVLFEAAMKRLEEAGAESVELNRLRDERDAL